MTTAEAAGAHPCLLEIIAAWQVGRRLDHADHSILSCELGQHLLLVQNDLLRTPTPFGSCSTGSTQTSENSRDFLQRLRRWSASAAGFRARLNPSRNVALLVGEPVHTQ